MRNHRPPLKSRHLSASAPPARSHSPARVVIECLEPRQLLSATAGSIVGSSVAAAPPYNLSTLGVSDWAHWGRGGNASNFDHDSKGGAQISNVTRLGPGSYGGYTFSGRNVQWSGGTPTAFDSGDDGYIWANNAIGAGYSFTVPAGVNNSSVAVYLGGYDSGGTVVAHLSDKSASDFAVNISGTSNYSDVVTFNFNAAAAGQTLTITLEKSQLSGTPISGSVDLIAAWLVSPSAAPKITADPAGASVHAGQPATFSVAGAGTPTPAVDWQFSADQGITFNDVTDASPGDPSFPAPDELVLNDPTVADTGYVYRAVLSNIAGTAISESATLTVSPAVSGSLQLTAVPTSSSYDLTTLGTSDWAAWGLGGNGSAFDHDAAGGSQISNISRVGPGNFGGYTYSPRDVNWTNGSPTAKTADDDGYVWDNGPNLSTGFEFSAPANTSTRTLFVYLGGYSSGGTLSVDLSDGSGAQSLSFSNTAHYDEVVQITYSAGSAGQQLLVTWAKSQNVNGTSGSVDLMAAWLQ